MLTQNLALDNATGTEKTFNLLSQDSSGTRRGDVSSSLAEPRLLVIKHSVQGQGQDAIDRHLVQFSDTQESSTGKLRTAVVNVTIAVPRDSVITSTIVQDLVAHAIDLLCDGTFSSSGMGGTTNLDAICRGES